MTSNLHTNDPVALRYLMTETIFDVGAEAPVPTADDKQAAAAPVVKQDPQQQFTCYGKNKRNYLFLTEDREAEWMSAAALDAFGKTLAALKLTVDDVAVLNIGTFSPLPSKEDIFSYFSPRILVSLGASFHWMGLDVSPEKTVLDYGGITVFRTYAFDEMLVDAEKKRVFWTTIKNLLV